MRIDARRKQRRALRAEARGRLTPAGFTPALEVVVVHALTDESGHLIREPGPGGQRGEIDPDLLVIAGEVAHRASVASITSTRAAPPRPRAAVQRACRAESAGRRRPRPPSGPASSAGRSGPSPRRGARAPRASARSTGSRRPVRRGPPRREVPPRGRRTTPSK